MVNRYASADQEEQAQAHEPERGPAQAALNAFVGTWNVTGKNAEGAQTAAGALVTGEESYDWLPGEYFLIYRWQRRFEGNEHIGIGIIGFDMARQEYWAQFFDNLGYSRTYDVEIHGRELKYSGAWERARLLVHDDGDTMSISWERSVDGVWLPLCDLEATRSAVTTAVGHL